MRPPKPNYNVFLIDLPGILAPKDREGIAAILKSYFDPAARGAGYSASSVTWQTDCPLVGDEELLIYFVTDYRDSVLMESVPPDMGAMTYSTSETGSEVYIRDAAGVDQIYPVLANLAFHEALHNKTHLDDGGLHPTGGLAGPWVTASTRMTPAVLDLLTRSLPAKHRQFTGGCAGYGLATRAYLVPSTLRQTVE